MSTAPFPHESAQDHVTGAALYTDDLTARFAGLLHAWPVCSPHAHAIVKRIEAETALAMPGIATILLDTDVPGEGDSGTVRHDEPLFPGEVLHHQQPVAWVLGETLDQARAAAERVVVEYEPLPAIVTIEAAIEAQQFLSGPHRLVRNEEAIEPGLAGSAVLIQGELRIGGQEHFYLETQCAIAWKDTTGGIAAYSSTQHPAETQEIIGRVLGLPKNLVTVECVRMGGAFGGKESQANPWCAIAAVGAWKTGRPVSVRLTRALDMSLTGKRHPFLARYTAGFSREGKLQAARIALYSDGGWSLDLSEPVLWRAMFHSDNAYLLPAVELIGYICRTNKTSQTAFRGFGGPQGMLVIEEILAQAAPRLGMRPEEVRERNFYREGDTTHYGQPVKDASRIETIWRQLETSSEFLRRRREIARFNETHIHRKRGMAMTPMKFGISFTATLFNQAGALVLIYKDGSVQVNHGGTEMGQGLYTKVRRIAAETLGLPLDVVRMMPTRTDKVPNTSATAASAGTDLNGAAVLDACAQLRSRLDGVAAQLLGCDIEQVRIEGGQAFAASVPNRKLLFRELCEAAYRQRLQLFAHGFYRTPEIHYDPKTGQGRPFYYYAYGAAVSEVEIDGFTGDTRVVRVDLLEDVGESVSPTVDRGQIEGGFIQGLGWLTIEELRWDEKGRLATAGASTYKLPSWSELPDEFYVNFLPRAAEPGVVFGSKAVGEPPLMLAISVREAIRDAIAAFGTGAAPEFSSPATPEEVYFAIQRVRTAAKVAPVEGIEAVHR